MGKRKYRFFDPPTASRSMLENLLTKIPEMKTKYSESIDAFARDTMKQNSYQAGVELWIATMRSPTVRSTIAKAVADAKATFQAQVEAARTRLTMRR